MSEVEPFLLDYPEGIREQAQILRALVHKAVPDSLERVRPGWRLIGYDVQLGSRKRYFAYVAPEPEHVHLGFEHGILLRDPMHVLEGAHLALRKVRYLTYRPGEPIPERRALSFIRQAAALASLDAPDRMAMAAEFARR